MSRYGTPAPLGRLTQERLEIFLVEGTKTPNWFWYVKDKSGRIIKRCRPGGCESYMMAAQEVIDEYNALQKGQT